MGLPWIRLDTSLPDNPKVLHLLGLKEGHRSAWVYACGLAYSGKHGQDGFIPREALTAACCGRLVDADRLVEVGLWHRDGMAGWIINGWSDFQESNEETQKRRAKAQIAARARWDKPAKQGNVRSVS